jgi:glycosyltransferase involved in cell wall biosynthesis
MVPHIHLIMLTYNRLDYTRKSLPRLLADPTEEFSLTIWDNGSTDGTKEFLKTVSDRRIVDVIFSQTNKGQAYVTDKIWHESSAELVGKVDNDCLVTPGWTRVLAQAHEDIELLGAVGCWHFFPDDFDYERAKHKIQRFGKHQIFRHAWLDGSALLVKRRVYEAFRPCRENEYLTKFWIRLTLAGYINGFYYPLIFQEHMDDPRSKHTLLKDEDSYQKAKEFSRTINKHGLETLDDRWKWRQMVLDNLLDDPWDAKYYVGWRAKLRRIKKKVKRKLLGVCGFGKRVYKDRTDR